MQTPPVTNSLAGTVYGVLMEAGVRARADGKPQAAKAFGEAAKAVRVAGSLTRQLSSLGGGFGPALNLVGAAAQAHPEYVVQAGRRGGEATRRAGATVLGAARSVGSGVVKRIDRAQDTALLWGIVALAGLGLYAFRR